MMPHNLFIFFLLLGLTLWGFSFVMMIWGTLITKKLKTTPPPYLDAPYNLYPVSILKPLKGADPSLEKNIRSFLNLDYPDYEILFCIKDQKDEAYSIIQTILSQNPNPRFQILLTGDDHLGINPKVNNLLKAYDNAKNDLILISDSNVIVQKDYLKKIVGHLDASTGVITAIVAGIEATSFSGKVEAAYLNTFYARWMALTACLGKACVIGKSMLFRRSAANRFGGIKSLARYLAEDYMAGEAMKHLGLKVIVQSEPITQVIGKLSFKAFWDRHIRWGRIRKAQSPLSFIFEPVSGALFSGVLGAYCISQLISIFFTEVFFINLGTTFFALHLGIWAICDAFLMNLYDSKIQILAPFYWLIRESLSLPLWAHALLGNSVKWRGQKLKIEIGGIVHRI